MSRAIKFEALANHAWLGKSFKKLKKDELLLARNFLEQNAHLDKGQFEFAINRMFINYPNKPKNWTIILEMLANSNVS